ncbi:MAG TPA: nickel-dependent lactate racemase [Dehalococcoidia bacterium]|nr:nickel-dependent lactate racemase [Dehalococcoidia bacterium]
MGQSGLPTCTIHSNTGIIGQYSGISRGKVRNFEPLKVELAYGDGRLPLELPEERSTVITPTFRTALPDAARALHKASRAPINSGPLREIARKNQRVAISICDVTRAQPQQLMVRSILDELEGVIRPGDVTILIATGTHRANTEDEVRGMLGDEIASACRVVNHVARDESSLDDLGVIGNGVPVKLNREWTGADLRITTGFVEPHFFAGFSGGPKMVAPGLAGIDTVLKLHDASRIGHPNATWGVIEGNPVHDDVRAIARAAPPDFSVDVLLNSDQQVTAVYAGELFAMHAAACAQAKLDSMQAIARPFDLVITSNSGYPLDQNLYQAVKGMSAAARVVRPGGLIVCAAECRDGIPNHGSYSSILTSQPDPPSLLEMIETSGYSEPDQWQVQIQAKIQMRARVLVKSDRLSESQLNAAHFETIDDIQSVIDAAGSDASICVLPEGPQTIPFIG